MSSRKDPAAVSLGKRGGAKKVPKGFAKMDPAKRSAAAKAGAAKKHANWLEKHKE